MQRQKGSLTLGHKICESSRPGNRPSRMPKGPPPLDLRIFRGRSGSPLSIKESMGGIAKGFWMSTLKDIPYELTPDGSGAGK